jgi:hypothetical protein
MIEIAKYRRLRMLKKMAFARKLQKNAALFQGVGAYYRKDTNPKIRLVAQVVIRRGAKVRLYAIRALAVLRLWVCLRGYAWPLLARDNSMDRKFWVLRFIPAYQALEEKSLALVQLTEPHLYEPLRRKTSQWRGDEPETDGPSKTFERKIGGA